MNKNVKIKTATKYKLQGGIITEGFLIAKNHPVNKFLLM